MALHSATSQFTAAADIGGTQMRAALISRDGRIVRDKRERTLPERGIEDAAIRLAKLVNDVTDESSGVIALGVSTAGPINPESGTYDHPPNLTGWHGKSMKPSLENELKMPVAIGHDATLAALAETRFGPFKGAKNLVYVTISTGIGGGIIANGQLVTGSTGQAGEVGHISVRTDEGALSCNVGCHGCFEANASGPSIGRMALAAVKSAPSRAAAMLSLAGGDTEAIDARMVFNAARDGDVLAEEVVRQVIDNIGRGLASLLSIFDPDGLVVGGGVANSLRHRWDEVIAAVARYALPRYQSRGIPISITELGDDVSLLGASVLAFRQFES